MKIESERVKVNASPKEVFDFIKHPKNIESLLPMDKVSDFVADEESCSFKVQGGITITLVYENLVPNSLIQMVSGEKSPFPFKLDINIVEIDAETVGFISFDGEVNAFMKMMVQKPLTNLFNYMSLKMKEKYA